MPPRDLAAVIIERLPQNNVITQCDIAGPGFINFHISQASNIAVVETILTAGEAYGRSNEGQEGAFRWSLSQRTQRALYMWGMVEGLRLAMRFAGFGQCRLVGASGVLLQRCGAADQ